VVALRLVPRTRSKDAWRTRTSTGRPPTRSPSAVTPPGTIAASHVGRRTGASFRNESSPTIRLDVAHGGFCEAATCTPEDPGLTYIRTEHPHGYVVRRGQVDVRVMALAEADRTLLRQAALSARPATDAELLRGLPPWTPDDAGARFHRWLHSF
jgi:hypothetical protein